jgi:hypothetical protein
MSIVDPIFKGPFRVTQRGKLASGERESQGKGEGVVFVI